MTVVIPLNVLDIGITKHLVNAFNNILSDFFSGKIENKLISAESKLPTLNAYRPIGMSAVKIAVGVYTLGLKPKTELHSHAVNSLGNRLNAAGQLSSVLYPVAKSCKIVVSLTEPAVIKNEHLYS